MTSVAINFRNLAIALAAIGLVIGAAFGAGIAYGRTEDSDSTTTAANGAGQAGGGGLFGGGGQAGGGGLQGLFGGATTGTVTAVEGDTVTIETAQGSQQVHVSDESSISLLQVVELSDLSPGTVVIVSGDARDDESIDATSINQMPPQLEGLGTGGPPNSGGGGAPQGPGGAQGGTAEPTAAPAQVEPTPTVLPDRTNCDEIRGTEYRSASEREFFLANCTTG